MGIWRCQRSEHSAFYLAVRTHDGMALFPRIIGRYEQENRGRYHTLGEISVSKTIHTADENLRSLCYLN